MTSTKTIPFFELGRVVATPGALEALRPAEMDAHELLWRHVTGDWGDVGADDAHENELSVREGFRILTSYRLASGVRSGSSPRRTGRRPIFSYQARINNGWGWA